MRLRDIYYLRNFKYHPKSFFNNDNRTGPQSTWNYAFLNSVHIPSATKIAKAQKDAALTYLSNYPLKGTLENLNKDFGFNSTQGLQEYYNLESLIQKALENFKDEDFYSIAFLKQKRFPNIESLTNTLRKNQNVLNNTLNILKNIYDNFKTLQSSTAISFPKKVQTQLNNLNGVIKSLEADLSFIKNSPEGSILSGSVQSRLASGEHQGYLAYTRNIANELKGFLLPLEIIKHCNDYAEATGRVLLETGSWSNSTGQEIPIDIIGANLNSKVIFSGKINEENFFETPLQDIIKRLQELSSQKKQVTVRVDNYDDFINQLQKENAIFAQSKAGRFTPPISNKFQGNISQIANFARDTKEGQALIRLMNLKRIYSARIYVSHEQYDALFSYCLSKQMDAILGYENNVILTPYGFMPIDQWIKQELVNKYYQPRFTLSLTSQDTVPIALK